MSTEQKPGVAIIEPVGAKGGMQFYDLGLSQALADAGVVVSLYSCGIDNSDQWPELRIWRSFDRVWSQGSLLLRAVYFARASLAALYHARKSGYSLIHFHFFGVGVREAFLVGAARRQRLKVVITAHDIAHLAAREHSWLARHIFRTADAVIVHNQVSYDEIERLAALQPCRVHVIPHGNYLPFIAALPSRAEARARLNLDREGPILLFFGQIKRVKGLDLLLRALPAIRNRYPGVQIVIAGRVWKDDFSRYRAIIDELGIGGQVDCRLGYIDDREIADYFAACDLAVLPYRRIYQSGVLLLAMSHACAVLTSDIPGMTEIVHHGKNGWVFRSDDSEDLSRQALAALDSDEQRAMLAQAGRDYVRKHHDWANIARHTAEVYRAI